MGEKPARRLLPSAATGAANAKLLRATTHPVAPSALRPMAGTAMATAHWLAAAQLVLRVGLREKNDKVRRRLCLSSDAVLAPG